ncbi:MAG: 4-hydroxy-3-methylbut-2-enyl diphosphate reductase [Candidatus Omnitrophota bacterium]
MIKIKIAKNSGFCFGVKRAVDMTIKELETAHHKTIYSIGHIIHNKYVIEELSKKGLIVAGGIEEIKKGTLIIRCHGLATSVIEEAKKRGLRLIDATCPYVMNSHKIVEQLLREDYRVVVVGDKNHPEIQALCDTNSNITVVDENTDVNLITRVHTKIGLVAQTTLPLSLYKKVIRSFIKKGFSNLHIFNTICNDTRKRQFAAKRLAKSVDCILVVGGASSANSKRLYQICKELNSNTYQLEHPDEFKAQWVAGSRSIGIVSGASTPDKMVTQLADKLTRVDSTCKKSNYVVELKK